MKLLVGLGNPGRRYARSRHNVGFRVLRRFATNHGIVLDREEFDGAFGTGSVPTADGVEAVEVALLEPHTFMNLSGGAVAAALATLPVEDRSRDLLVVLDDVDLPFGRLRLRHAGGAGGHRGLGNLIERLGRTDLPRLRFGVGRPDQACDTKDYVLGGFSGDEEQRLEGLVSRAADAAALALTAGVEIAMNRYNPDPEAEPPAPEDGDAEEPLPDDG